MSMIPFIDMETARNTPGLDGDLIVFDADCIVCSGFARFIAKHDTSRRFAFVTAQSDIGKELYLKHGLDPLDWSTNIVRVDGQSFLKMSAFCAAMNTLGGPWRAFTVLNALPSPVADWVYDRIARNRYVFGRRQCPLPDPSLKDRIIG